MKTPLLCERDKEAAKRAVREFEEGCKLGGSIKYYHVARTMWMTRMIGADDLKQMRRLREQALVGPPDTACPEFERAVAQLIKMQEQSRKAAKKKKP